MVIDLHIHSTCSDGVLKPKEIIDKAKDNGLKIISITDHDSISAYTDEIFVYAKSKGITLISGIEFSSKINKCGIHILGYNIDLKNKNLIKTLKKSQNARREYLVNVSKKLNKLGYKINVEDFNNIDIVTKAHISKNIVNNPNNKELLVKSFGYIPTHGEFIETIMNEECPAYVKKFSITPEQASKIIKDAGGKVVLAHPVTYKYEDNLSLNETLNLIDKIQPNGLESYYIYVNTDNKVINEIKLWNKIAKQKKLISTIGSDYHMSDNIHPEIGLTNYKIPIKQNELLALINLFCK